MQRRKFSKMSEIIQIINAILRSQRERETGPAGLGEEGAIYRV